MSRWRGERRFKTFRTLLPVSVLRTCDSTESTALHITISVYRVSSKTVPTWLFALLLASTHAICKSWEVFEKFRKFATR